jgi:hypothetical protein
VIVHDAIERVKGRILKSQLSSSSAFSCTKIKAAARRKPKQVAAVASPETFYVESGYSRTKNHDPLISLNHGDGPVVYRWVTQPA